MNPTDEAPESHVNGQTNQIRPQSSATPKAKPRPKKGINKVMMPVVLNQGVIENLISL
jgi:hypothetical protein